MIVIGLDTATSGSTVALARDGVVLGERHSVDARRHAEVLLPMADELLRHVGIRQAQITDVVVGLGPGAYTGLRVGVATASALASALGARLHGVMSLDAMAQIAYGDLTEPFTVVVDARRREVFWADYDANGRRSDGPHVSAAVELVNLKAERIVVGAAGTPYEFERSYTPHLPDARGLLSCVLNSVAAWTVREGDDVRPLYLRRPDVTAASHVEAST